MIRSVASSLVYSVSHAPNFLMMGNHILDCIVFCKPDHLPHNTRSGSVELDEPVFLWSYMATLCMWEPESRLIEELATFESLLSGANKARLAPYNVCNLSTYANLWKFNFSFYAKGANDKVFGWETTNLIQRSFGGRLDFRRGKWCEISIRSGVKGKLNNFQ